MTYGYHDPFVEEESMETKMTEAEQLNARKLREGGMSYMQIACRLGDHIQPATVAAALSEAIDDARELDLHDERCERGPEEEDMGETSESKRESMTRYCYPCHERILDAGDCKCTDPQPRTRDLDGSYYCRGCGEAVAVDEKDLFALKEESTPGVAPKDPCFFPFNDADFAAAKKAATPGRARLRNAATADADLERARKKKKATALALLRRRRFEEESTPPGEIGGESEPPTKFHKDSLVLPPYPPLKDADGKPLTSRQPNPAVPGRDCECREPDRTHFPSYDEGTSQRYYCRDCGGRLPEVRDLPSPLDNFKEERGKEPKDLGDVVRKAKRLAAEDDDFDELELSDFMKKIRTDVRERLKKILTDVQHTRTKARECDWTETIRWLGKAKTNVDELLLFVEDVRAEHGEPER